MLINLQCCTAVYWCGRFRGFPLVGPFLLSPNSAFGRGISIPCGNSSPPVPTQPSRWDMADDDFILK